MGEWARASLPGRALSQIFPHRLLLRTQTPLLDLQGEAPQPLWSLTLPPAPCVFSAPSPLPEGPC